MITLCDDCPCKNDDYENGNNCNLGFQMEYRADNGICSVDCGLDKVIYTKDSQSIEYTTTKVEE